MLYSFLKIWVRLAALIFCRKIITNNPSRLKEKGPLLIASNHPNSFLDAVIIDILFEQPVWSLARGDAFVNKPINRILQAVKIKPIYRTSEGVENLSENYKTFDACIEIFKKNGAVQIFSEGKCINEWHLRPLKKGTARIAFSCWDKNIPLKVLPLAINYSSFRKLGKNIFIYPGNIITGDDLDMKQPDGLRYQRFNNLLKQELEKGVFEIDKSDGPKKEKLLEIKIPAWKKIVLFLPAVIGFIVHAPVYLPTKYSIKNNHDDDHYDSLLIAVLFFTYPFYLLLITLIALILFKSFWVLLIIVLLPFTAWSYVQLKRQI
jgi:1-acyl-sn-glycerol-3-phosphate acyltransferase